MLADRANNARSAAAAEQPRDLPGQPSAVWLTCSGSVARAHDRTGSRRLQTLVRQRLTRVVGLIRASLRAVVQRTAIILNPHSGSAPDREQLCEAVRVAALNADVIPLQTIHDGQQSLARLADAYDVLVAAGGDGTVSTVAAAAVRSGKPLGVLPAGTLNHFARDAGIPLQLEAALDVLAAGHTRLTDVASVNDEVFVNNVSIGAYPRLVWERSRARHVGWPRPLATSVALLRTWIDLDTVSVRITLDTTELVRRTPFVLVGNGAYEVEGTQFGERPTMAGGTLSLYLTPDSGRFSMLVLPLRALIRRLKRYDKFETYTASSIVMKTRGSRIGAAIDGEIRNLETPLRFAIRREALRTIVPAPRG